MDAAKQCFKVGRCPILVRGLRKKLIDGPSDAGLWNVGKPNETKRAHFVSPSSAAAASQLSPVDWSFITSLRFVAASQKSNLIETT